MPDMEIALIDVSSPCSDWCDDPVKGLVWVDMHNQVTGEKMHLEARTSGQTQHIPHTATHTHAKGWFTAHTWPLHTDMDDPSHKIPQ